MNTTKFQEQILQNAVQMDASINFQTNGNLLDKEVTGGERVKYRGGVEVDADGRTRVKRYNIGKKGPLHDTLFETPHGAVKITRPQYRYKADGYHKAGPRRRMDEEFVYVMFKFPKKYGLALTKALYEEEADEIMSYLSISHA